MRSNQHHVIGKDRRQADIRPQADRLARTKDRQQDANGIVDSNCIHIELYCIIFAMIQFSRRALLAGGAAAAFPLRLVRGQGGDAPASPITNRWGEAKTSALDLEEICVFRGRPGAAYNHHHQILFHGGRLYASWSNGIANEDHPGQHMLCAVSDDDGKSWSAESTVTPPPPEKTSTYTAMGIRAHQDLLIAYYGHYGYNDAWIDENGLVKAQEIPGHRGDEKTWIHRNTFSELRISKDRGASWGKPMRLVDKFVPNLRPFPLRNGRLLMTGNITFPYTDDPAGIRGWKSAGLPRLPKWTVDDPEGFHKACFFRKDPRNYCEGSFYQTDDGKIHMMLRTDPLPGDKHNGLLAVTESADNAKTWSEPMLTNYTDCSCRFHFGRLPDGRYFGLSCPKPKSGRTPMVLATSRDGVVFDRHYVVGSAPATKPRMPGHAKGGAYGYPTCDIANGKMYIIFSRSKEDIYFAKLNLDALS